MAAPLSIIIPTLNAGSVLPKTLLALMEGLDAGVIREVIIADGGSTDNSFDMSDAAGCIWLPSPKGRGAQLRHGAERARGDWLFFLHADTELSSGWSDAMSNHISAQNTAAYCRLAFRSKHPFARVVAGWANLRSRIFGLPYGDQALLVPRRLYDALGGYAAVPLMEDVMIARALKGRLIALPITATTDASRYEEEGWLRRGAKNLTILLRFLCGANPKDLVTGYERINRR